MFELSYEVIYDLRDREGDALAGVRTYPVVAADSKTILQLLQTLMAGMPDVRMALDTLSMGMTGDLEAAVAEGSTMVRVGTAIFGERLPRRSA